MKTLFFWLNLVPLFNLCDKPASVSQLTDEWWKTDFEPPTTPEEVVEIDEDEDDEVGELDSLGRLHNELADADSFQENIGDSNPCDTEPAPSASDKEPLGKRKTRLAMAKGPYSRFAKVPYCHLLIPSMNSFLPLRKNAGGC